MMTRAWFAGVAMIPLACGPATEVVLTPSVEAVSGDTDPNPVITFTQVATLVGINRSNEPASAGSFSASGTLAYGGWLVDLDGDGRLDYFGVNHGQWPHLSGLFINNGAGGFGKNLFTVSVGPAPDIWASMGISNEVSFVGDLTGDGRVDFFFKGWSGLGVMCANQGVVHGSDWVGPGYLCFETTDALAFADVNGDGKIDVLAVGPSNFDVYATYYAHTGTYLWRLNDGTPDIRSWPTTQSFTDLRVTDPSSQAAPFVDLDGDTIPDKIVGLPLPPNNRGTYATATAGKQVYLGQAAGGYVLKSATGLEGVTEPITAIEDVNDDGCIDIGTDVTGYRDNQNWYVQNKTGASCNVTFTFTPRTALPYYPGFKRYTVDIDNSGLLSKVVLIHKGYGNNDGLPGGVSIYRKRPDGGYSVLTPAQSGVNINGPESSEFYADNLSPGDWNDDGRVDLAGTGTASIANTDSGFALWRSGLVTTNGWIKVTLPTVTGFFTGSAVIEVFDAGFAGDPAHVVTPPRRLYPGRAWASQVYHLGIGRRAAVDVRVTFPNGHRVVRAGVVPGSRISIEPPTDTPPPPPTIAIGGAVFTPNVSAGVVKVAWYLDGALSVTTTTSPFSYSLNLAPVTGAHALSARAYDAAGNVTTSAAVIIQK